MVDSQLEAMNPEMYERLIDRLGLALDVARTAVRLRDEVPAELELRGLSPAEFELINAYLDANRGGARGRNGLQEPAGATFEPARTVAKVVWLKDQAAFKAARRDGNQQAKR